MEESKEDYSFLNPRPPSLIFGNRNFLAPRKLHFTLLEEEEQENISGNVKVYLRIKPATLSPGSEGSQVIYLLITTVLVKAEIRRCDYSP
jgi:hypothetical protein